MNYYVGGGRQETCRRVGGAFARDPAGKTEGLRRRVLPGILPIAGQNRAGPADRVLAMVMELGDPQELRLHEDQRPDGQHARWTVSKELSFYHYDAFAPLLSSSSRCGRGILCGC